MHSWSGAQNKHRWYQITIKKPDTLPKHYSVRFEVLFHYFGHFEVENDQKSNCLRGPEENWSKHCAVALLQSA